MGFINRLFSTQQQVYDPIIDLSRFIAQTSHDLADKCMNTIDNLNLNIVKESYLIQLKIELSYFMVHSVIRIYCRDYGYRRASAIQEPLYEFIFRAVLADIYTGSGVEPTEQDKQDFRNNYLMLLRQADEFYTPCDSNQKLISSLSIRCAICAGTEDLGVMAVLESCLMNNIQFEACTPFLSRIATMF